MWLQCIGTWRLPPLDARLLGCGKHRRGGQHPRPADVPVRWCKPLGGSGRERDAACGDAARQEGEQPSPSAVARLTRPLRTRPCPPPRQPQLGGGKDCQAPYERLRTWGVWGRGQREIRDRKARPASVGPTPTQRLGSYPHERRPNAGHNIRQVPPQPPSPLLPLPPCPLAPLPPPTPKHTPHRHPTHAPHTLPA
jgi:hypothetical protein